MAASGCTVVAQLLQVTVCAPCSLTVCGAPSSALPHDGHLFSAIACPPVAACPSGYGNGRPPGRAVRSSNPLRHFHAPRRAHDYGRRARAQNTAPAKMLALADRRRYRLPREPRGKRCPADVRNVRRRHHTRHCRSLRPKRHSRACSKRNRDHGNCQPHDHHSPVLSVTPCHAWFPGPYGAPIAAHQR